MVIGTVSPNGFTMGCTKRGSIPRCILPRMRKVCLPVRVSITAGTVHDCKQAGALIDELSAEWLLANRGYDSNAIIEKAISQNMKVVIPPKKNRRIQRKYNVHLYKLRHLVENAFLHLKR